MKDGLDPTYHGHAVIAARGGAAQGGGPTYLDHAAMAAGIIRGGAAQDSTAKILADPLDVQIGGDHYKTMAIQPMEFSMANGLDACQHTIVKYITRFRSKGGIQDLEKAKHTIDLLIQFEKARLNGKQT